MFALTRVVTLHACVFSLFVSTAWSQTGPWGLLGDMEIRTDTAGEEFVLDVTPDVSGSYNFEVCYGYPMNEWYINEMKAKSTRLFHPIHENYGACLRLEVVEIKDGKPIAPAKGEFWATTLTGNAHERIAADVKTYRLRHGRTYRATLFIDTASVELQEFRPQMAVEMTDATRENSSFSFWQILPRLIRH